MSRGIGAGAGRRTSNRESALIQKDAVSGVDSKESCLLDVIWPPNATTGRHLHFGDEYGEVIEDELQLAVDGQSLKTVKAGQSYHNLAGVVHETKNVSGAPARGITVLIIDKGQPVTEPVK